ncbi:MAG: ABC transporter substrate-binding protein [Gaiellaceae bacterium]
MGLGLVLVVTAASARPHAVKDGGTLEIGVSSFDFIDPALASDPVFDSACGTCTTAMWGVADATCATLFRYPVSAPPVVRYNLVPEAATGDPVVSHDGKTYTFTIRKGLRFSTGAPVTAANYVRAFRRVLDPVMHSPGARYLQDVAGVNAVGGKLIVHLAKKVPDFPARTTMPYLCPVPTDLPAVPEGVGAPLPGSGPYYVAEFVRGVGGRVVLKRNPFYARSRPRHLDEIIFRLGGDSVAITHKVEAGDLDVDLTVPLQVLPDIAAKYGVNKGRFFSIRSADMFYLFMNTESPLFKNNVKLRQAVNFAVDRTAYLGVFGGPFGSRTDGYLPTGLPGHQNVHPYPVRHPNIAKAKALASGHTRSGKAAYYSCDSLLIRCLPHAQHVQQDLKQIGIDVEIRPFPVVTYATKVATRGEPWDIVDFRVNVAWVDPSQYVDQLLDGRTIRPVDNTNLSYFNSAHYNRLIDHARSLSGNARYVAYGKLAVEIERDAAPMAGLTERNTRFFVSSRVGCVRATGAAAHGLDFAGVCLK